MVNSGRGSLALAVVEKWQSVLEILSVESCFKSHFAEPRSKGSFQEVEIHPWSLAGLLASNNRKWEGCLSRVVQIYSGKAMTAQIFLKGIH